MSHDALPKSLHNTPRSFSYSPTHSGVDPTGKEYTEVELAVSTYSFVIHHYYCQA